ncbi:MAG: RNA polymerase factor sigma-32 [Desulfobacteraceae bacterium]|nr:RNA polymerase factor sigma-32 [Desulfobacteraceae bacterium]
MPNIQNTVVQDDDKKRACDNIPVTGQFAPIPQIETEEGSLTHYDFLQIYLHEIKQYTLLTRDGEIELSIRAKEKNDDEAAYKLIVSNLRLVVKIAMDFHRSWTMNLLDLIQEGNLGLMQAVRKFDPYRGIKFSYYASFWIKANMLKFLMENWKLIKIGTTQAQRKLFFNLNKERDKLIAQGFDPQPKLLAECLSVKEKEIVEMTQRLGAWEVSLNTPVDDESGEPYEAILPESQRDIDERLSEEENRKLFTKKLKEFRETLCGREIDIFDNRILAEKPKTLQDLGDRYHISRERIRQIQKKLVSNIEDWLLKEIPNFKEEYSNLLN